METLNKFKYSTRHIPGKKLPLLSYCEYLMQCAPAYRPISLEESMECVKCALDTSKLMCTELLCVCVCVVIVALYREYVVLYIYAHIFVSLVEEVKTNNN